MARTAVTWSLLGGARGWQVGEAPEQGLQGAGEEGEQVKHQEGRGA